MQRRTSAELALIATVVIWALNFTAVKVGVGSIPPLAFSVTRFALGAAVTLVVAIRLEGRPRFRRADLPWLLVAALIGITINQAAFVGALRETTASNTGELLALVTAASWAVYSVLIRPLMARYTALSISSFMMVAGTVALVPFALPELVATHWATIPGEAWLGLLYAALLSVSLTNILYFTAIGRVGASRAALYTYLEPFLGVMFATVLIGERVTLLQLAGGLVIVAAIVVARPRRQTIAEPGI